MSLTDWVTVAELAPGDRFTTANGTTWTFERHDELTSWAVRSDAPGGKPVFLMSGGPVGVGERDRFSPHARVVRGWVGDQ